MSSSEFRTIPWNPPASAASNISAAIAYEVVSVVKRDLTWPATRKGGIENDRVQQLKHKFTHRMMFPSSNKSR